MRSALYEGTLVHVRRLPVRNVFRYPVSYWLLDLDELPELDRQAGALLRQPAERHHVPRQRPLRRRAVGEAGGARSRRGARRRACRRADDAARARLRLQPRVVLLVLPRRRFTRLHGRRAEQHLRRTAARGAARPEPRVRAGEATACVALLRARPELRVGVLGARRIALGAHPRARGCGAAVHGGSACAAPRADERERRADARAVSADAAAGDRAHPPSGVAALVETRAVPPQAGVHARAKGRCAGERRRPDLARGAVGADAVRRPDRGRACSTASSLTSRAERST